MSWMFGAAGREKRRRRRGAKGTGRTRIRLAEMLTEALGYPVYPENIWEQNHNASYGGEGFCRWGWRATKGLPETPWAREGSCWDTMGECVRNGFTLHWEDFVHVAGALASPPDRDKKP